MRKLLTILLAALLGTPVVLGQVAPDNDDIFEQTLNHESPYYYPSLMLRYRSGDTTLTEREYYYLYYGYAFSDDYRPLMPISAEDRVLMAFEKAHGDPSYDNMRDIVRYAEEVMRFDPFSPTNLNFLAYAYGAMGDTLNERINYDRLTKVLAVIGDSGTGLTEKSPMHVLRFSHAADVLGTLGLSVVKRLVVSRTTEYITVANENGRQLSKGYYFDYSRVYWGDPEDAPQKERRWKINDYPVGGY